MTPRTEAAAHLCVGIAPHSAAGRCDACAREWWRTRPVVTHRESEKQARLRAEYEREHAPGRL
jgi:hypothetical protein